MMQSSRWQKEASVAKYAAELERIRKQAAEKQKKGKADPKQKIVEGKPQERVTDHKIAEAIGTNRQKAKANQQLSEGRGKKGCQNSDNLIDPIDTKKELAKAAGVSHDTVAKVKNPVRWEFNITQRAMSATLKNGSNQYKELVEKIPPVKPLPRVRQIFLTLRGKRGGDRRSENFKSDNITLGSKPKHGSTSRLYIEDRLQRNQQEAKP